MPLKREPWGPGKSRKASPCKLSREKKKKKKAKCKLVRAVNRFSVGFPWHLPDGWEHSQSPRGCTAAQGSQSSPLAASTRAMPGGGRGHPPSQDALGCLFTEVGDFF